MLRPTKHSHPDHTVINVALIVLQRIKVQQIEEYDVLLSYTRRAVAGGDVLFHPSLNFLYLMGLIEYHPKIDTIEYVGPNETL